MTLGVSKQLLPVYDKPMVYAADQLEKLAAPLLNTSYGAYLMDLLGSQIRPGT